MTLKRYKSFSLVSKSCVRKKILVFGVKKVLLKDSEAMKIKRLWDVTVHHLRNLNFPPPYTLSKLVLMWPLIHRKSIRDGFSYFASTLFHFSLSTLFSFVIWLRYPGHLLILPTYRLLQSLLICVLIITRPPVVPRSPCLVTFYIVDTRQYVATLVHNTQNSSILLWPGVELSCKS